MSTRAIGITFGETGMDIVLSTDGAVDPWSVRLTSDRRATELVLAAQMHYRPDVIGLVCANPNRDEVTVRPRGERALIDRQALHDQGASVLWVTPAQALACLPRDRFETMTPTGDSFDPAKPFGVMEWSLSGRMVLTKVEPGDSPVFTELLSLADWKEGEPSVPFVTDLNDFIISCGTIAWQDSQDPLRQILVLTGSTTQDAIRQGGHRLGRLAESITLAIPRHYAADARGAQLLAQQYMQA